jgi:hypothetical protein
MAPFARRAEMARGAISSKSSGGGDNFTYRGTVQLIGTRHMTVASK